MKNKLKELLTKQVSKSSEVIVQVEEKRTNTDPFNLTAQTNRNLIEVKTYSEVAVQIMEIPSDDLITNSTTTIPEVNQEITINKLRRNQITTPY